MSTLSVHRKTRAFAPKGFFACEAAGLRWMGQAQAHGGPRVAKVIDVGNDYLDIERISSASATRDAALRFGAALARMHDAGADYFGSAPDEYSGTCYFGPLQDPVPMATGEWTDVSEYFADARLRPMVQLGIDRGELTRDDMTLTEEVIAALPHLLGAAADDTPARVHGDLWSGNLMWTADSGTTEAVLIDPAAHGGHREEDLAMLDLFGVRFQDEIMEGYDSVHPLADGVVSRFTLWQLYPIAGHCVFFGGGYISQYRSMCHSLLR